MSEKRVVTAFILVSLIVTPAVTGWWLDVQWTSDNIYHEYQYDVIDEWMDGEYYSGYEYYVCSCEDWPEEDIVDSSMGWAKVWHFAGHGGYEPWMGNYMATADDEELWGSEVPDLDPVQGGGACLLMFFNTCHSGRVNWLNPGSWLCTASRDEGAKTAIGHEDAVTAGVAYDFADAFYEAASAGYSVGDSFTYAKVEAGADDAVLFGNGNTVLVD